MTIRAFRLRLVVAAQALHFRLMDLSVFLTGCVADRAIQNSSNVFPMRKGMAKDFDLRILKTPVAFVAFSMGYLCRIGQRNGPFGVAGGAGCPIQLMTFETGLFRRAKRRGIMGVVINIIMAGSAGIF